MTSIRSFATVARRSAALAGALVLLAGIEARAQLGDGVCVAGSNENTARQCAILGPHVLEIVPPGGEFPYTAICQTPNGPKTCAFWPYRFSGPSGDNQLNILVPANLEIYLNQVYPVTNTAFVGCQQVYTNGQGDPTTGFGKGIITDKVCRVALNIDQGSNTPNFVIATSLSSPGPDAVQSKSGKGTYFDDILGPFGTGAPRLSSTMQQITTISGAILTVETNQAGALVSATSNTGPVTIIPPGIAVLCTPLNPSTVYPNGFPAQYDCGPIVENLDGTNMQAGLNSTCYYRRSDGTLLRYTC
jgi:hypothetical protein